MDAKKLTICTIHYVAREGRLRRLMELLEHQEKDEVVELVGTTSDGTTPLVMACRNGHYDVAEYLIEKCGANVNQTGLVMFDGEVVESAPPLWCAAAAGHLALVKLLVKNGASVDSTTKTFSTPLRAACFDGHFDIVRFLVAHGADIEMANRHGHTSLMIACFKGHVKIAKFLLALKADVNRKSIKGNTALHDCAESGSLEVVKLLIEHGARMDVDCYGMSPLLTAAVTGHKHIVEYFISIPNLVSRKERIDALELLGATYVDKKRDMMGALQCWKQAMEERYRGDIVIPKPPPSPAVAAYNFAQEITDPDALDGLLNDPDEMRMQALVLELKRGKQMSDRVQFRGLNRILVTILHLASLLTYEMPEEGTPEYTGLNQALYELVRINAKDNNGRDVLQLAISERGVLGPKSLPYGLPSPHLIKALIRVGADVTARDDDGNTVLHLADKNFPLSKPLIPILLDAGAHIDAANKLGIVHEMFEYSDTVYPMRYMTLQCLAARVVRKTYDIALVPKHLRAFVELH
ncbi:unnamed protein product [Xylocopa violacea]|uniref:Uncharacterized protein n=1 Tax=Xylocopa violacea TaxID=135666 RepID=A0ABP1NV66_XYLVO